MILIDTNILIDAFQRKLPASRWALFHAIENGDVGINSVILAELLGTSPEHAAIRRDLPSAFKRLDLPYEAGSLAARAFAQYKVSGGKKDKILGDFYIGAHAEVEGFSLLTRDLGRYQTYFPKVNVMYPE